LLRSVKRTGCVVTAEEHSTRSGLGCAVACTLSENYPVPLRRVGTPDCFGESGDSQMLMSRYGLTAEHITASAEEVIRRKRK
jgi:transketolase